MESGGQCPSPGCPNPGSILYPTTPIFLTLACSPTTAWPEAGLRAGQVWARAQAWGVAGWGTQVGKVAQARPQRHHTSSVQ